MAPDPLPPLWSTPLGVHRFAQADEGNPVLVRVFRTLRATDERADPGSSFYASRDDLLQRVRLPDWDARVHFIADGLHQTVALANQSDRPEATPGLQIALRGIWFQIATQGSHHDVHTHGNCSWSGVQYVQVDDAEKRAPHRQLGSVNGVTRFYGPHINHLDGAHMAFGNAYLQSAHLDIPPVPGQLVVFLSWLPHHAMHYNGEADRIIVSFHASVHAATCNDQLHGYSHV